MENSFYYRQQMRQHRLEARRRQTERRRIRSMVTIFTVLFMVLSIVSANAIIAKAGNGYEKNYMKLYKSIVVERGETVIEIAEKYMTPGYESVDELMEEIGYINSLNENYMIKSGNVLVIPYFAEVMN